MFTIRYILCTSTLNTNECLLYHNIIQKDRPAAVVPPTTHRLMMFRWTILTNCQVQHVTLWYYLFHFTLHGVADKRHDPHICRDLQDQLVTYALSFHILA